MGFVGKDIYNMAVVVQRLKFNSLIRRTKYFATSNKPWKHLPNNDMVLNFNGLMCWSNILGILFEIGIFVLEYPFIFSSTCQIC
jgi:hypothetical protein